MTAPGSKPCCKCGAPVADSALGRGALEDPDGRRGHHGLHDSAQPPELVSETDDLHGGDGSGHTQGNDRSLEGLSRHESTTSCTICHVWGA